MRDLGSGEGSLLEAQQADFTEPYIKIDIGPSGDPDYSFSSLSDEIISVEHIERPFGGTATIVLNNYDKSLKDIDFRGRRVEINYWFEGVGGDAGTAPPLWVFSDRELSSEGQNQVELICIDVWNILSLLNVGVGGTKLAGTITGSLSISDTLTGETSGATGTVILVGADYVHVGDVSGKFVDGEKAEKNVSNYITIDSQGIVGSSSGPAYNWDVRTLTIENILDQIFNSISVDVDIDETDGIVDTYKPTLSTTMGQTSFLNLAQDLLRMTKCGFRIENDEDLHLFEVDETPGDEVYTYDSAHAFYVDIRDLSLILPNRVICVDGEGGHKGSAEDAAAIAQFRDIAVTKFISAENLESDSEANDRAAAELSRSQWNSAAGQIIAPMNVGQELFDYIKIIDSRNDITYYGWVGGIIREWESGVYRITLELGNLTGSEGIPGGKDMPAPNIVPPAVPGVGMYDWKPITMGAYIADVDFTPDAYNHVDWAVGSIKFADGRSQHINSGELNLTATHYIYCIWGNPDLQNSTSASDAVGTDRVLVAVVSKASTSAQLAYALNPYTDSILINTDKVMDGLVTELKLASEAVSEAKIATSAVSGPKIQSSAITAAKIDAGAVTAVKIQAGAVTAAKIAAGAVTAIKIDVATLDAITANVGTLTSGIINGVTIYAGDEAIKLDSTGLLIDSQLGGVNSLRFKYGSRYGYVNIDADGILRVYTSDDAGISIRPGQVLPFSSNEFYLGVSNNYWLYAFVNHLRFKDWSTFQKHDDVKLLKQIKPKVDSEDVDMDTVPDGIKEDGFINLGATVGLLAGAITQLSDRLDKIEERL